MLKIKILALLIFQFLFIVGINNIRLSQYSQLIIFQKLQKFFSLDEIKNISDPEICLSSSITRNLTSLKHLKNDKQDCYK